MNRIFLKKKFSAKIRSRLTFITLILILIAGFYLRIGGIISFSFAFTYDVGRDMLELQRISNLDIPLIGPTTGLAGLYYGPWWYYILTPAFLISRGNPQGVAFFMVLTGLAAILLGYFLGKMINGKTLELVIASFISLSAVTVGISSQIWNPNIIPPLIILVLILLMQLSIKKSFLISFSIGFLLGLIFDSEIVFGVLFVISFIFSYIYVFKKKLLNLSAFYIALGFFATLLPRLLFETRHGFVMTKSFLIDKGESQRIFDYEHFFNALPERITTYISQFGDTFGINFIFALFIIFGAAVIWITLRKYSKKKELTLLITSLIILSVFIIGSSFFARAIWGHYIVGLPVLYIIIVSLTLILLSRKYLYLSVLIFAILLFTSLKPVEVYSNLSNPNWEGDAAVYRNQLAVINYIYKNAEGKKFNYTAYTPAVHDYAYRYLFDWYGRNKYNQVPEKETQDLLYIIIEPDPGYEGRITDWLKIREGDGKVINEQIIKGGIKVQTRTR